MDVESFPSQNDRNGPGLCSLLNVRCWVHWSTEHGPIHCQQVCCQRYDGGLVHGAKVWSARNARSCLTCKCQNVSHFRQEKPKHHVHLMTVSPFIVDTGMVRASKIRFPGILFVQNKTTRYLIFPWLIKYECLFLHFESLQNIHPAIHEQHLPLKNFKWKVCWMWYQWRKLQNWSSLKCGPGQ